MTSRWLIVLACAVSVAAGTVAACSADLNPQPLPPKDGTEAKDPQSPTVGDPEDRGGASGGGSSSSSGSSGVTPNSDASADHDGGTDATTDAPTDSGDGG